MMAYRTPSQEWRDACIMLRDLLDLNAREAIDLIRHFITLDNALEALS